MNPARPPIWQRLKRRAKLHVYLLCLLWAALVLGALYLGPAAGFWLLARQELATVNLRFQWRGVEPPAPEIVLLSIDERSFVADTFRGESDILARSPELGLLEKFPFPRRVYAAAIQRLCDAGAKVVALDLLFLQPTDSDEPLRAAIQKYRDHVVIGSFFSEDGSRLTEPAIIVPDAVAMKSVVGYVNFWRDADRFVRRAKFQTYESAEAQYPGRYPDEQPSLSFDALVATKYAPGTAVPGPGQHNYINFPGPPATFPAHEFYKIFYDKTWHANFQDGAAFRNKIVLIGPGGDFQHDTKPTPFGAPREMPGVEIHAAAAATLLHGTAPHDAPAWVGVVTTVALALAAGMLLTVAGHPTLKVLLLLLTGGVYCAVAAAAFNMQRVVLLIAAPGWTLAGSGFLGIATQLLAEQLEKRRVRRTLERYVSKQVAEEILRNSGEFEGSLGGQRRLVTMLFSDIRGFTSISEQLGPVELVALLNEYLTAMVDVVLKHDGTLDKFIGDAIMAVYGAPTSRGAAEDAWRAVQTAVEMRAQLTELQKTWEAQGRPVLKIGIGLNCGEVVVGNIGSPQRMEYTVIGDPVNVASRVEGLNKEFGTDILLTESVYELTKDRVEVELIGSVPVKGRAQPAHVYHLKALKKGKRCG